MQVSVEAKEGLERRLSVEVPAERVDQEVENRLRGMISRVRVDGFRPGKVPLKVIKRRFGAQVRHEVMGDVIQSSFYEAVSQEKLRPAGQPSIEPTQMDEGQPLAYTATFEVYPDIELAAMDSLKIERPVSTITAPDIEKMMETLRKQRMEWNPVDRESAEGDQLKIDFKGIIEGEGFQGNEGREVPLVLGSNQFIPGFEEALVGARAGDSRTVELEFPADYPKSELAGKPVRFEVTVKAVSESRLPEIDEEFAKVFGVDGGVADLRAQVEANMQRELDQTLENIIKNHVMDALLEANPIEVPAALVNEEIGRLKKQAALQFGGAERQPDMPDHLFRDQAGRRVKLGLILAHIIQAEEMKVDPERLRRTVERIASTYEKPDEVVQYYYAQKDRLGELESVVIEEQVVDRILEQAQVTDKETPFNEVMNPRPGS